MIFNDNGGWPSFENERTILNTAHGTISLSSLVNAAGAGGIGRYGDVDIVSIHVWKTCDR